jgi:hypothetical protein
MFLVRSSRSSSRTGWSGSPGSRHGAVRPGGASPTGPPPSFPPGRRLNGETVTDTMYAVLGFLVASAAGAWAWRHWFPRSFWYAVAFPLKAVCVYLTWRHVAYGCTLTRKRRAWRLSLEAVPGLRTASVVIHERRRVRRVDIDRAPRLGLMRPTVMGWRVRVRLHDGQIPDDYVKVTDRLAHAWRVYAVRAGPSTT